MFYNNILTLFIYNRVPIIQVGCDQEYLKLPITWMRLDRLTLIGMIQMCRKKTQEFK